MFIQIVGRFEFAFHFLDEFQRAQNFRAGELAEVHAKIIMSRRGFGLVREQLPARGDALDGEGGAFRVVRGKIRKIITRAGKMPRGGEIIRVRLQLNLRAMKFRPGAGGENRIVGWLGDRRDGQTEKGKETR